MRPLKHKRCLVHIMIIFIIGNLVLAGKMSKQAEALRDISDMNKMLIERVKEDQAIADSIAKKIEEKQSEVLTIIQGGDVQVLKDQATQIKEELAIIFEDFSNYKLLYEQNKISQGELEAKLSSTKERLNELDAKFAILQTAISTLDGSIQDRIKSELGDIDTLKEQIKQEIIQELSQ